MVMYSRRQFVTGVVGGGVVLGATGQVDRAIEVVRGKPKPDVYAALLDVTSSSGDVRALWRPEMVAFGQQAAKAEAPFYAAAFDGRQLPSDGWPVQENFGEDDGTPRSSHSKKQHREALSKKVDGMLAPIFAKTTHMGGSPLLSVLKAGEMLADSTPDLDERTFHLALFTDAVIMGNRINGLKPITDAMVEEAAAVWGPRLDALRGARLYFVGVGMGVRPYANLEGCEAVVRAVADACGARVHVWSETLGETFR